MTNVTITIDEETHPYDLAILGKLYDQRIRLAVAQNKNTPIETLKMLTDPGSPISETSRHYPGRDLISTVAAAASKTLFILEHETKKEGA